MSDQTIPIGPLMKAARKFKKLNQAEVAKKLGCSQSALSKMEHNQLVPNAPQWFVFARFTAIPPETIETGIIDRHTRAQMNNENVSLGYTLPKRFRLNRAYKVREVYPFWMALQKLAEREEVGRFIKNLHLEEEFFLDFDNLISFQLVIDIVNLFISLGLSSVVFIQEIVVRGQDEIYWDRDYVEWREAKSEGDILDLYVREQEYFQDDFIIQLEKAPHEIRVSFIPSSHLYQFLKDVTPETRHWLLEYRKLSLENLFQKFLDKRVQVISLPIGNSSLLEMHFLIPQITRVEGSSSLV